MNLYTDSSPECGFKDAEIGIPTLPVTVTVDGVNQDYQFKSVSDCFAYLLGLESTYYCLPLNGSTLIPVASNNKIGITVKTSGAKEVSGIWMHTPSWCKSTGPENRDTAGVTRCPPHHSFFATPTCIHGACQWPCTREPRRSSSRDSP